MLMTDDSIRRTHVRRLVVAPLSDGWEVREEEDGDVITIVHRHDWHQVERDRLLFDLRERGTAFAQGTVGVKMLAGVT